MVSTEKLPENKCMKDHDEITDKIILLLAYMGSILIPKFGNKYSFDTSCLLKIKIFEITSPSIAPRQWPTCNGPVGFAETNSIRYFFLLFLTDIPNSL